jgi:mRNA interferase RelE/StbE
VKVKFKSSFLKAVSKHPDKRLKLRIAKIIEGAEIAESINDLKNLSKLKGCNDCYHIRIGQYRIGLKIENNELYFVAFAHRKDIYKTFP